MERIKGFLSSIFKILKRPELAILPGHIAFFLVLSMIPIITLIVFIASSFSVSLEVVTNFLVENLPVQILDILEPFIYGKGFTSNVFIYIIIGFYLASNGPKAMIVASNTLYNIKGYNFVVQRIKAIFMTLLLVLLIIFLVIVLGFGNSIMSLLLNIDIFSGLSDKIYFIYILLKWPIAFTVIFVSVKFLYTLSPDKVLKSRYVNKGALFTTVMWLIVSFIYSYYVNNIANYNIIYGNLSSIIVLMLWIYVLSLILVVGIAINANNYEIEINEENK